MDGAAAELAPFLQGGERLVWSGRPDPAKHFTVADLFLVPFSLFWTGLPLSSFIGELGDGGSVGSVLPLLPFVVIGLYLTAGRFVWKAYRKRRTVYGVTDRRVLTVVGDRSVSDAPLAGLPVAVHRSFRGRHLSVTFGTPGGLFGSGAAAYGNTGLELFPGTRPLAFYDVGDPEGLRVALDQPGRF